MIRLWHAPILAVLVVLGGLLSACSSCGSSSAPVVKGKSVYWAAPQFSMDNTPLVPSRDLQGYEIYIRQDSSFGPSDSPVATASALDTTYKLTNVSPPLSHGVTYYVSMRTVTVYGLKSDFSPAVSFSLP
jgi:hypothetical protein